MNQIKSEDITAKPDFSILTTWLQLFNLIYKMLIMFPSTNCFPIQLILKVMNYESLRHSFNNWEWLVNKNMQNNKKNTKEKTIIVLGGVTVKDATTMEVSEVQ